MLRIAHRGLPRLLPENTLASFSAALEAGAQGIELDVHATSDGVVVVHHDARLSMGTEIATAAWSELRAHDVAPGTRMPTLDEVCLLVDGRCELFVEIKAAAIEEVVVRVLRRYSVKAAIHSFDHALIGRLASANCGYRLGLLLESEPGDAGALLRSRGAHDLWPERRLVNVPMIERVHAVGGRVIPWTVNDPAQAAVFGRWGVDGICTDDVSLLP